LILINKTQYNNNQSSKKTKVFSSDSDEIRLAELLLNLILERNPEHKRPNIQTWARPIDLMIRVDKRSPAYISEVIHWCQCDSFWQSNILSTAKLREKFDQLASKMNGSRPKPLSDKGMRTAMAAMKILQDDANAG
jgi:hypothetical protein